MMDLRGDRESSPIDGSRKLLSEAEALEALGEIHGWMSRASCYRNLSGPAAIAAGLSAVAGAALLSLGWGPRPPELAFCAVWGSVFAFSVAVNLALIARKASQRGEAVLSRLGRTVLASLAPGFLAGGIMTWVLASRGLWELVPGAWMLLYGCAVLAARFFSPRGSGWLGLSFLALGTFTLLAIGDRALSPWVMAGSFGLLHVVFGLHLVRQERAAGGAS
jgi:hypothetical protein